MTLTFEYLGFGPNPQLTDYEDVWEYQHIVHDQVASGERDGHVIMTHHAPVYTAGRQTKQEEFPQDGTPVVEVDRGGHITYHGPGQLVCYPIVRLAKGAGVVDHVRRLEAAIIELLGTYGLSPIRMQGRTGVWFPADDQRPARKICAIGIKVSRRTTLHGLALNIKPSTERFANIIPCGITDAGVTSLTEEKPGSWNIWKVAESLEPILAKHLTPELD